MATNNKNLQLIQVLRGVASLLVVLFHATMSASEILHQPFLGDFFAFGFSGLDIFFVLSGFIITYTSFPETREAQKPMRFLRRRVVRIFPIYWLIITGFLALQLLFGSYYSTHYAMNAGNLLATYFLLPGHVMLNGVSWTLTCELFFYLVFTLVFLFPRRWVYIIFTAYSLFIMALPFTGFYSEQYPGWLNMITFPMNIEFFMGILAAVVIPKIPQKSAVPLIAMGVTLFIAGAFIRYAGQPLLHGDFNRVLLFGVPSFVIIVGVVKYEINRQVNAHNILLYLGEASYSLYLLHLPLIAAFSKIILRLNVQSNLVIQLMLFLVIAGICCLSILFYKFIEKPVITRLNAALGKRRLVKSLTCSL